MKLLIVTQVIDTEHPILGFFHRWVEEFAKHYEYVHVICLEAGKHNLPKNVTVHSLGKEAGKGRFTYLWRFYQLIWSLRQEYDHVFVHMNQIYVILGAPFWWVAGKRVGLWYAHGAVSRSLWVAVQFAHHIFTSTEQGLRIETAKRIIVGQGIDTALFVPLKKEKSAVLQLITVGRIAASKNIDTLLRAAAELRASKIPFHLTIIGPTATGKDEVYKQELKQLCEALQLQDTVTWVGAVAQSALPTHLQTADIFIHDGATDSLDKALLEAVLCGCVVVSSNPAYRGIAETLTPALIYTPHDASALACIIRHLYPQSEQERQQIMQPVYSFVHNAYSISNLISGIVSKY